MVDEKRSSVVDEHLARVKSEYARRVEREFKIPVEGCPYPGVYWIACLVAPESLYRTEEATDDELRLIRCYIDYSIDRVYNEGYAARIREKALPACAGHNTVILMKVADLPERVGGWGYRRMTWETGSWPHVYRGRADAPKHALSLEEVLDHVAAVGSTPPLEWLEAKRPWLAGAPT